MAEVSPLRRLLNGWTAIVGRFGFVQTLVILGLFYAFIVGPGAVVAKLARQDLLDRGGLRAEGSAWREADTASPELERAKHGY